MTRHIAVIDIGKTNAKLVLVDQDSLGEIAVVTRPNTVLTGPPWPHFDVEGHWAFLLDGLRNFHERYGIDAISITAHGACAALLDKDLNLAAPILDYEFSGPDDVAEDYNAIRPPFRETGSPKLAGGLNIGAQLFWQFQIDPDLRNRTHQIVTYPQFWGAWLTGITATDVTSLGCHTDLWNPTAGKFSSLIETLGLTNMMAPVRKPSDVLGPLLPDVAKKTGLPPDTPVYCGIHDSNASLLPYVLAESPPFSVVSTGTWVIVMSIGGDPIELDPGLDTLINVTAFGGSAPSARFMGGREHDLATAGPYSQPTQNDLEHILTNQIMLLPAVVPETGPFKGQASQWVGDAPEIGTGARGAAVALYLALVSAECLSNIGHRGSLIVEGPFAANQVYLDMLGIATGSTVHRSLSSTGTSTGAALLAKQSPAVVQIDRNPTILSDKTTDALQKYLVQWKKRAAARVHRSLKSTGI